MTEVLIEIYIDRLHHRRKTCGFPTLPSDHSHLETKVRTVILRFLKAFAFSLKLNYVLNGSAYGRCCIFILRLWLVLQLVVGLTSANCLWYRGLGWNIPFYSSVHYGLFLLFGARLLPNLHLLYEIIYIWGQQVQLWHLWYFARRLGY